MDTVLTGHRKPASPDSHGATARTGLINTLEKIHSYIDSLPDWPAESVVEADIVDSLTEHRRLRRQEWSGAS